MGHSNKTPMVGVIDGGASGVSGDKYLGALVAIGGNPAALRKVSATVQEALPGVKQIDVSVDDVERGDVGAKLVKIVALEDTSGRQGKLLKSSTVKASAQLGLSQWGNEFVQNTIDTLLAAESSVHGHSPDETVLYELGSADTLIDIIGTAFLIEQLQLETVTWLSTPPAVGGGFTRFSGREYPVPPPAVLEILKTRNFPFWGGHEKTELTTPTGAAITVNLAKRSSESYPSMVPHLIGYGAGSKDLGETANLLRMTVGTQTLHSHPHDNMVILETNLDDVTGEVIGHAMDILLSEGARDVTLTPVYMKKSRPGNKISVITDEANSEKMAMILMEQTGSLGVREIPVRRHISNREVSYSSVKIGDKTFEVRIKKSFDSNGRIIRVKPEYEDLNKIARETGLTLKQVSEAIKLNGS